MNASIKYKIVKDFINKYFSNKKGFTYYLKIVGRILYLLLIWLCTTALIIEFLLLVESNNVINIVSLVIMFIACITIFILIYIDFKNTKINYKEEFKRLTSTYNNTKLNSNKMDDFFMGIFSEYIKDISSLIQQWVNVIFGICSTVGFSFILQYITTVCNSSTTNDQVELMAIVGTLILSVGISFQFLRRSLYFLKINKAKFILDVYYNYKI